MRIFGDDQSEEIAVLKRQIQESEAKRKLLAQTLATERKQSEVLTIALGKAVAELADAKRAVAKARDRQKASVERANRFKARLEVVASRVEGL